MPLSVAKLRQQSVALFAMLYFVFTFPVVGSVVQHLHLDEVTGSIRVQGPGNSPAGIGYHDDIEQTIELNLIEGNWIPDLWYGTWAIPDVIGSKADIAWDIKTLDSVHGAETDNIRALGTPRSLSVHPLALCNANWCRGYNWIFAHDQMLISDTIVTPMDDNVDGIPGLQGLVVPTVKGGTLAAQLRPERELEALYSRFGGIDNVIPLLTQKLAMSRDSASLWSDLGNAYRVKGESLKALQCFLAALRLQPLPDHYLNLGGVLITLEEFDEAVRSFTIGLSFDPNHLLLRFSLGHIYFLLGREEEASRELKKALIIQPGFAAAQTYIDKLAERKAFWQSWLFWGIALALIAFLAVVQKGASFNVGGSYAGNGGHSTRAFSVRHRSKKVR